jgi:hypothetical protein
MIRCPACGQMNRWSVVGIQPCTFCGRFLIMPDEAEARERGLFDGVMQPYHWEVRPDEVVLIFDAIDCLMQSFQESLAQGNMNDEMVGALSGSYMFAKLTRQKLRALVPDMQEETER